MKQKEYRSFYYDDLGKEPISDDFIVPVGTEMTPTLLRELINDHEETRVPRYTRLKAAYETKYPIFDVERYAKAAWKPDNRLAANFAGYIQDTFEGYYIGVPPDIKISDPDQNEWLQDYLKSNSQEDVDADLSDWCSEFGKAIEMLYQDEQGQPRSVALTPFSAFVVYDDSVLKRKLYGVRYAYDEEGRLTGSYSDSQNVYHFGEEGGGLEFTDAQPHAFGDVPMVEYSQNKDQRGIFEAALNLIDAYNKAISEKANDVDYFGDAYMVVKGHELQDDQYKKDLRESRLINIWNDVDGNGLDVYFLSKPSGDATQENFINRLEELIYKLSMVPDISDQAFGTASGIALKMRLLPMSNLARKKDRKFIKAMRERFKLLANYPSKPFTDWQDVEVKMNRNMPEDIASEVSAAASASGIVSKQTQLEMLSFVEDADAELERLQEEQDERARSVSSMFSERGAESAKPRKEATMYEITSVLGQRERGSITYNNALKMLLRLGLDEEEARELLDDKDKE